MFIPIGDDNPRERTPYVNYALLGLNVLTFLTYAFLPDARVGEIFDEYAVIPNQIKPHALITSMFLHGDFLHLAGNMLFLWIFGDNVEDTLGHFGYGAFYLACGLFATFAHIVGTPNPEIPTVGASGAISGVIGAYVIFYPHNRIRVLLWLFIFIQIILLPAWIFVGIWVLFQIWSLSGGVGGVAWWAHLGGILAGVVVAGALRAWWKVHRPASRLRKEIWESSGIEPSRRRPFVPVAREQVDIEFIDDAADSYAVVKLTDDPHGAEAIAGVVSNATGESVHAAANRIASTRGMIARGVPRARAESIQRELRERGYATALILDADANRPPRPFLVEAVTWNDDMLRLRMGDQITSVPWSAPFLYVAATVDGQSRFDLFVNRRTAYRFPEGIRLTKVDSVRRTEIAAVPSDLARDILAHRGAATAGEGVRMAAEGLALSFEARNDYEDYLFWIFNLALSRSQGDLS